MTDMIRVRAQKIVSVVCTTIFF